MKSLTVRRTVILGGAAALGATALSSYTLCTRKLAGDLRLEYLDVALLDIPFAARIAADYRQTRAQEDLVAELYRDDVMMAAMATTCPASRRAHLRAYAQEEFRNGKYCLADRLVVSCSERLIAALRVPSIST